jgi:ribosomal protein S18 acetylase RimI-like enzyme
MDATVDATVESTVESSGNGPILRATPADREAVAATIATSFHQLDLNQWLIPDPQERAERLPVFFGIVTGHALEHGTVLYTPGFAGVAVWLDFPFPDIPEYDERLAAACGPWADRFRMLDQEFHKLHPTDREHGYLCFLGVLEAHQGRGMGTALMRHRLAELDAAGKPSYLEASNARSRRFYQRLGYRDCAPQLDLPYDGEQMYPVWRDPA